MDEVALRGRVLDELLGAEREAFVELAESIQEGGCWGSIVGDVERICTDNDDYIALYDILVQVKDIRALFLFLHAARKRPVVFEHVVANADKLPRTVQCALVSLPEFDEIANAPTDKLSASAREVLRDPDSRREARINWEAHAGQLQSMSMRRL
jgi:hypothetical protein